MTLTALGGNRAWLRAFCCERLRAIRPREISAWAGCLLRTRRSPIDSSSRGFIFSESELTNMNSTASWDWWTGTTDWDTPAGGLLQRFFATLPSHRRFRFTLYGSAPLQLTLDRTWLSADVDLFSDDDEDLNELVRLAGLAKEQGTFYLEPGFALRFRTNPHWRMRAKTVERGNVAITVPHPLDILI